MKIKLRQARTFVFIGLSLAFFAAPLQARPPEESEFNAVNALAGDIVEWIYDLKNRPESVAIFSVRANAPLEQDFATIVETELLRDLSKEGFQNVRSCSECKATSAIVQDDRLIIKKAFADEETLKRIGGRYPVKSFLAVEIYRTKFSIIAQATLYENPSASILSAERFHVPAISVAEATAQVLLTIGPGKVLQGKNGATFSTSPLATMANISLLEELGFGKGGLNLGAITDAENGTLFHLSPTIAFRGNFGRTALGWGWQIGIGYGFTSEAKGVLIRSAYDFYLGRFTTMGLEAGYFLPDKGIDTIKSFAGFRLGISFGR